MNINYTAGLLSGFGLSSFIIGILLMYSMALPSFIFFIIFGLLFIVIGGILYKKSQREN